MNHKKELLRSLWVLLLPSVTVESLQLAAESGQSLNRTAEGNTTAPCQSP